MTAAIKDPPSNNVKSDTTNVPGDNKDNGDTSESKRSYGPYVFVFIAVIVLFVTIGEFNRRGFNISTRQGLQRTSMSILSLCTCIYVIYNVGDVHPIFKVVLSLFFIIAIITLFAFFSLAGVIPSLNISWRGWGITQENPRNSSRKLVF